MGTYMRRIMTRLILSFSGTSEAKNGGFRPTYMATEARIWAEKKDTIFGSTQQKIFTSTVSCGLTLTSCKFINKPNFNY